MFAGAGLLGATTGLPAGDFLGCVNALFGRSGPLELKSLAKAVERGLADEIATEHRTTPLEPVQAALEDLLSHHAPSLEVVVDRHAMQPAVIAAAILDAGNRRFDAAQRPLLLKLLTLIYSRYLAERQLLDDLVPEALRSLLAMRQEIEALPERTAEAKVEGVGLPSTDKPRNQHLRCYRESVSRFCTGPVWRRWRKRTSSPA